MKSRAAIALAKGQALTIADIDVEGPKAGEVLVRMVPQGFVIRTLLLYLAMILKAYFLRCWVMREAAL